MRRLDLRMAVWGSNGRAVTSDLPEPSSTGEGLSFMQEMRRQSLGVVG